MSVFPLYGVSLLMVSPMHLFLVMCRYLDSGRHQHSPVHHSECCAEAAGILGGAGSATGGLQRHIQCDREADRERQELCNWYGVGGWGGEEIGSVDTVVGWVGGFPWRPVEQLYHLLKIHKNFFFLIFLIGLFFTLPMMNAVGDEDDVESVMASADDQRENNFQVTFPSLFLLLSNGQIFF